MQIKILPNDKGNPAGKLADAELHFDDGPLAGLRLIGFAVWERRSGAGRNVTFPARQYSINGERRSFALLRPIHNTQDQDPLRDLILSAYSAWEHADTPATTADADYTRRYNENAAREARRTGIPQRTHDGGSVEPDGFIWAGPGNQQQTREEQQAAAQALDPRHAVNFPSRDAAQAAQAPTIPPQPIDGRARIGSSTVEQMRATVEVAQQAANWPQARHPQELADAIVRDMQTAPAQAEPPLPQPADTTTPEKVTQAPTLADLF